MYIENQMVNLKTIYTHATRNGLSRLHLYIYSRITIIIKEKRVRIYKGVGKGDMRGVEGE